MTKRRQPEAGLHGYAADLLRLMAVPNLIWLHIPNEGRRPPRTGAFLKRLGLLPGAADFLIVLPGGFARFLELKSAVGSLSDNQRSFRTLCETNGTPYAVAKTPAEVLATLLAWGAIHDAEVIGRRWGTAA